MSRGDTINSIHRLSDLILPSIIARHAGNNVLRRHAETVNRSNPLGPYFIEVAFVALLAGPIDPATATAFRAVADADALDLIFEDAYGQLCKTMNPSAAMVVDLAVFTSVRQVVSSMVQRAYRDAPVLMAPANDIQPS